MASAKCGAIIEWFYCTHLMTRMDICNVSIEWQNIAIFAKNLNFL